MTSTNSETANSRPPLLPVMSHSLSTTYHLQKILTEVQDCVNDINSLDISTDVNQGLKNLLESVQWRFLDVLTRDWLRGKSSLPYGLTSH
jgi:exocyst complex component 2